MPTIHGLRVLTEEMIDNILRANKLYCLFDGVKEITVALSGGADSVALLHSLNTIKNDFGFKLYAAHYHHGIRGEEADRDLEFCKRFCKKLNIELFYEKGDVLSYADKNGLSIETAARELRYDFLSRVAKGKIATAHTASDNVETVIFNIARGTSINGAKGIPVKRDNIIRPIVLCSRECVENYCKFNNLDYVTDSTNLVDDCSRNIIRHKIVPILKEINEGYVNNISRLSYSLSIDGDYLLEIAKSEFDKRFNGNKLCLVGFTELHQSIKNRVLILFFKSFFGEAPDTFHIDKITDVADGVLERTSIVNDYFAVKNDNYLIFTKNDIQDVKFEVTLTKFSIEEFEKNKKVHGLLLNNAIDCDKIVGEVRKIARDNALTIKLANSNSTKTLKKLLTEKKLPIKMRNELPLFSDDIGLIWGYKIGVSDRVKIDKTTKKVLYISTMVLGEK